LFTEKVRSGLVAIYSHINKPRASQKGIHFISSILSGVEGQSFTESIKPEGKGVVIGEHRYILKCLSIHS